MEQGAMPTPSAIWSAVRSEGSKPISALLDESDFRSLSPPEGVHWIGRKGGVFWDPGGADQFAHSLWVAGIELQAGHRYLDFGCSSGRTVRTFAAANPDAEWHGCDPTASSIQWASAAMPHIQFRITPQEPPTDYDDALFDGIYAVSVWSHFSKDRGLAWLSEMHRLLKPGGWLVFSTHGAAAVVRQLHRSTDRSASRAAIITRIWHRILEDGFVFYTAYNKDTARNLDTDHWGLAYMGADWVAATIAPKWALLVYDPARYGGHQDIYVLQKR